MKKNNIHIFNIKIMSICMVFLLIIGHTAINAQESLKKEVQVVKPYEPAISDAFKINTLPQIVDTNKVDARFDYPMKSFPVTIDYKVTPIKVAKMVGEPLKKLYSTFAKIGFGNYLTPFVQIDFNSKYNKKYLYQAGFMHQSSSGKVKNELDKKVFSGYSRSDLNLSGKRFFKEKSLSSNIIFNNLNNYYYGFNPALNYTSDPPLKKSSMSKQAVNKVGGNVRIESNYLDSARVNYNLNLYYSYMQDFYKINEQNIDLNIALNYFFENEFVGVDTRIEHYNTNFKSVTNNTDLNTIVQFKPWIGAFGPKWRIVAGLNTFYELDNASYNLFPSVKLHYNVIDYFFIPYFEMDSKVEYNSYEEFLFENPYYYSFNSKSKKTKTISGGIRGNFSSNMSFNFRLDYADVKNMYFYVNDTNYIYENRFTVIYDNAKYIKTLGEIAYKKTEKLNFLLKAEYNHYNLENIEKPWHKPGYKISFNTRYNLKDKIILNADVFAIDKRYAKEFHPVEKIVELNSVIDVNLGIEYRYSKILSAFLHLNNIAAQQYYEWNYYPSQKFNFLLGVSYSF